jgi:hypothetical protein
MPKKKTAARTAKTEAEPVAPVAAAEPVVPAGRMPEAAEAVVDAIVASGGAALAQAAEEAMARAVLDIQAESEAIAAETGDENDKQKRIAALNDPVAVRTRMLEYRLKALNEVGASAL